MDNLMMTQQEREEALKRIDHEKIKECQILASASGSQYPEYFSEWIKPTNNDTELIMQKWNHNTIYPIKCEICVTTENGTCYLNVGTLTYVPPSLREEYRTINSWDNLNARDFAKIFKVLSG